MSTSYGLLCELHNDPTGNIAQWEQPVLDAWKGRAVYVAALDVVLSGNHSVEVSVFGIEDGVRLWNWMREHAKCPQDRIAVESEYGDLEGMTARLEQVREPDADEWTAYALRELGFPDDVIARTAGAIVDRLAASRVLSTRKYPERLNRR